MKISAFARFKGGFLAPSVDNVPEQFEEMLKPIAKFVAEELAKEGIGCSRPNWGGYDYELQCSVGECNYAVSLSFDFVDWEWFEVSYNPTLGFLGRLLGRTESTEMHILSTALNSALLRRREGLRELRWYAQPLGDPAQGYTASPEIA